ncbi:DUF2075 domain-containing protein [bacterium]|nr:MAG: DUF2075 domain-containing protein [bacterium]
MSTDSCGWNSDFQALGMESPRVIRIALEDFVRNVSAEQLKAWDEEIDILQRETGHSIVRDSATRLYTAILEYQLPLESRRPDVIFLQNGSVVVVEFKSKGRASRADLDQVAAYARDLRCYHRECANRVVHAILIPTRLDRPGREIDGVHVAPPHKLPELILRLAAQSAPTITPELFLREDAYSPLPTLVKAARELFQSKTVRKVWRAAASTDPAVDEITRIAHEAHATKTRRLVLLTGVPGAGKTLVGLRLVHAKFLDDLAVARADGKPASPAVFLSGNAPLVQVLQYELRSAGGEGRTFVRDVKKYVSTYAGRPNLRPPEHLLVFDEAQRAWDAERVDAGHQGDSIATRGKSEPEHFVEFAERIPDWCVIVGLIGSGQEIHVGEEGGLGQWRKAVEQCKESEKWVIHAPQQLDAIFSGSSAKIQHHDSLNLTKEIRYHLTTHIHQYVEGLLEGAPSSELKELATQLSVAGHRFLVTRSLELAKQYVRDRYLENADARYGLVASAKDKLLENCGVPNSFQDTKLLKVGPWFSDGEDSALSCRRLDKVVTEFQVQGLELDCAVLAWGSDFIWNGSRWSNDLARGYKDKNAVKDPFKLRLNSYRVLLTRGRDGTVIFVPEDARLDATHQRLLECGMIGLET